MTSKYFPIYLTRILCFSLALHFFNLSIDSRDKNHESIPEDLTVNDIESLAEFFVEVVLGKTNAFREHDESDHESGSHSNLNTYYFSINFFSLKDFSPNILYAHQFKTENFGKALPSTGKISSPPPKG